MMKDITTFTRRASSAPTSTGALSSPGEGFLSFQGSRFVADTVFLPGVVSGGVPYGDRPAHDAGGALIASDDDSSEFGPVGLTGSVGAGGTLNLSVFTNPLNEQSGAYSLRLSLAGCSPVSRLPALEQAGWP